MIKRYKWLNCCILIFLWIITLSSPKAFAYNLSLADSLNDESHELSSSEKSEYYLNLFVTYHRNKPDSALLFAEKSKDFALEAGDSLMYVRALYAIGYTYKAKNAHNAAIQYYHRALSTARNNNFLEREKTILNGLALAYYYDGKYDEALKYNFESLALREDENNKSEIAIACNNIGLVYYKIKDFTTAIKYFDRSFKLKSQTTDEGLELTLINLGLCYTALFQHDEAIENYERALALCKGNCREKVLAEAYNGVGIAYYYQKEYEKAKTSFEKAINIAGKSNIISSKIIAMNNLARIKMKEGKLDEALKLLNESQAEALRIDYNVYIASNFELYGEIYSKLNNYNLAYKYQKKYDSLTRTILNEEVIQNLTKIQTAYQERENLQTISIQRSEITRRTTLLILSIIIIIMVVVIVVILYRNNQHRRRVNLELTEANDTIEQQNNELTNMNTILEEKVRERTRELHASNAALLKSNTELDNFIYKTSHDIRGPLATLQGVCNVALIDIKDRQAIDYFQKLGKTAARLNEILSKLLVINQINNSLVSKDRICFETLVSELLNGQQAVKTVKEITVNSEIQNGLNFRGDLEMLKIILQNLISNAFKFHNTSGRVRSFVIVVINKCGNDLAIRVIDNGIGIDENVSSKIFEIFSKASDMSDTAGLGLYLVKLAVEKLQGEINLTKTHEGNTQFEVRLPYR